ncbi:MAG: carotenoid biosynthesis protein [Deltaproteobacteria bacterium]|nr:carotenoid biosynthesis protein [Deltaproteobacteria bacterium]
MHLIPWILLAVQAAIVVASLLGYGIFTARPDLLMQVDPQARFFTWAFSGFAIGNMLFGGLAVVADALMRNRLRALVAFIAIYAVSLASELMGTGWGIPFGPYSYTHLLGPKWFGLVPYLIPLSWFTLAWVCWVIARQRAMGMKCVLLATWLLVAWDLLLDPAMSKVTSYWVWGEAGSYYGMPWSNLFGWAVTGLVLFVILHRVEPEPRSTVSFAGWVYFVNFALPLGFCALNQYWLAVAAGIGSVVLALVAFRKTQSAPESLSALNPKFPAEAGASRHLS